MPSSNEWNSISQDFYEKWQLPNFAGAIDGKHINITCPSNAGSLYYNYKAHHSIVLLPICDAKYCFTTVDIGAFGSESNGGIFACFNFGKKIIANELPSMETSKLPHSNIEFTLYFAGDAAFPLRTNLMRPFPGRAINERKEYFNKRLSRGRRMIENTFEK